MERGDNIKCITLLHQPRAYTMTVSVLSILHLHSNARIHIYILIAVHTYFRFCPLPLSRADCLSSFAFYDLSFGLSFIALYRFLSFLFSLDGRYLLRWSIALTRRDPLRIIAQPNRPNDSLPLYWPLSDALHLLAHVEFQNKRRRLIVRSRRHSHRSIRVGNFRCSSASDEVRSRMVARWKRRSLFSTAFTAGFPSLRAMSVCPFPHGSSPPAFCSRIRMPFVQQFASLLILRTTTRHYINAGLSISEKDRQREGRRGRGRKKKREAIHKRNVM